jgi:small subunit ribosomal protein S10
MPKGRIRIKLKAYDYRLIDDTCQKLVDTAIRYGASIIGPIPLPTKTEVFVVKQINLCRQRRTGALWAENP